MADGHLNFDTKIDESGFSSGVSKLGGIAKSGLKVLGAAVASVTAAMGAGVAAGLKYNATIEQYATSFEVMTGSATKATEIIEELKELGAKTPFEMEGLADTTQLLMNYGFTADDAIDKMMMLGDISQGNAEKMNRIAMAYGQMSSAGKVALEDVKQMIEAGFNPLQEISESTGESMASLYDRISNGTLTVDEITASMERATSAGGKYYQSMEKQAQTFNGMISTLKDNAMQLLGSVVEPITESMTEELLPAAIEAIEGLQKAFDKGGLSGMIEAGGNIIQNFLTGMMERLPAVMETAFSVVGQLVSAIAGSLPALFDAGVQTVQGLIDGITQNSEAIATKGIEIVVSLADKIVSSLPTLLSAGLQMIMALAKGIIDNLPVLIEKVPEIINEFFNALWGFIPQLIAAGLQLIVQLGVGIIKAIPTIIANAGEIAQAILNVIGGISLFKLGKTIVSSLGNGLKAMIANIKSVAQNIRESIKQTFSNISWSGVGRAIIQGMAAGIAGGASLIISAARNAAKNALKSAKKALGIHSPSTVFRDEVGKYMAEGIGVGFEENVPTGEMNDALKASVNRMQVAVAEQTSAPNVLPDNIHLFGHMDTKDDPPESTGDTYEIHVHSHIDGHELVEETIVITDEELGRRNIRKERGNAG